MRLLLVEDDADTREIMGVFLGRCGVVVDAVGTFEAAQHALASRPYAILMTDLRLPDGDGRALLQAGRPPSLRFAVVVTGSANDEDRRLTLSAGFDAHLVKPLDAAALGQLIANVGADPPS